MGKRRNKNKARRALVGASRNINSLQHRNKENLLKMSNIDAQKHVVENLAYDLEVTVQVTEMQKIDNCVTENDLTENKNQVTVPKKSVKARLRKSDKVIGKNRAAKENDVKSPEILIYPTEVDGETCIDIECGANEAVMYLSRLCVGSKGACINFADSWFTPNEFQLLSGRETAKDWKRSIRHKGRSLKLLICKGLIQIKSAMPKKSPVKFELDKKQGQTETNVDASIEVNVAEENVLRDVPKKLCDIPKPKRGRKHKTQRPSKKTGCKENVYFVADDVHIATEHDNSNTVELPTSLTVDTRTDEERRLDEFVKSLRLTKITAPSPTVPSLNLDSEHLEKEETTPVKIVTDDDEPEMPILQKEADVFPLTPSCNGDQSKLLVVVDTFHATVTPPPTPPSHQADTEQKILDDRLVGTFKSQLTSPSVGLKLRINREKVKLNVDFDEIPSPCVIEPKIQSILLQDALQSAKKYKEQLHQNKLYQSPTKAVIQIPHIDSNFKPADYFKELKGVRCSAVDQRNEEAVRFQFSSSKASFTATSPIASSIVTSNRASDVSSTVLTDNEPSEVTARVKDINVSNDIKNELGNNNKQFHPKDMPRPFHNFMQNAPIIEDVRNLNGMNFNEFIALMTSAYGPLPFSADNRDAARAFAALQDLHRNHDMFNFTNQRHPEGTSPLLYPMITQQFLLAMTQQLYSLCNVPNGMPQQLPNLPPQMLRTSSPRQRSSSQKSKETTSKRAVNCTVNQLHDLSRNKRKHFGIDSEYALDLSTKKPRVEAKNVARQVGAPLIDGPLDFSIKKPNMYESGMASSHDQRYIDLNGYAAHLNRNSDYSKGSSYIDHEPVSLNNYTNAYKPNEFHSHLLPYDINRVSKQISPSCRCSVTGIINDDVTSWSVERVCYFLKSLDGCGQYAKTFHDQGISGQLLPYLTTQHLTRTLGMKVGPALTLMQAVERKFREQRLSPQSPCTYCRSYPQLVMPLLMLP